MEYIDRRKGQIQRAQRQEQEQKHWNEVHEQLLAIQKKSLEISDPNDADEKEADAVARKVVDGESAEIQGSGVTINRKGEGTAETTPEFQSKLESSKGGGQPLDNSTRSEMESKMGTDFSGVKIHTGSEANKMNESVNAKAFTHGQDIYFKQENFDTGSKSGKELLAHELVHTVQQGKGIQTKIQRFEAPGHEAAERVGLTNAGFTNEEASMVYFGNWMRDMNQVFVPAMTKSLGPDAAFALVSYTGYMKFGRQFTPEQFGYYIPAEHIDNPAGQLPGADYLEGPPTVEFSFGDEIPDRFNTKSFGPRDPKYVTPQDSNDPKTGAVAGRNIYAINQVDNVMMYIMRTSLHVEKRLELAVEKGRTPEGMMHFGAGLHAVEDLFAHSNFVEIALNMMLKDNITEEKIVSGKKVKSTTAFLPELTGDDRYVQTLSPKRGDTPVLLTGTFTGNDTFVSIGSEVVKMLRKGLGPPKSEVDKQAQNAMILQILKAYDLKNAAEQNKAADALEAAGKTAEAEKARSGQLSLHDTYQTLLTVQEYLGTAIGWAVETARPGTKKQIDDAVASMKKVVSEAMNATANQVEAQMLEMQISETTLTQADKDQKDVITAKGGKQSKLAQFAHDQLGAPLPTPADNLKDATAHQDLLSKTPAGIKAGPSHSQLAKDHDNSIFHGLAFSLAAEADRRLGDKMIAAWGNKTPYKDPDSELLNKDDASLDTDQKERKAQAKKRKEEADKSLAWGKSVIDKGHADGVTYDLAVSRKQSADNIRKVAASLQTILDAPSQANAALTQLQGTLSKLDRNKNYQLINDLAAPVIAAAKKGAAKLDQAAQDSVLGKVIARLKGSATLVENAITLAEREAAFASLKSDRDEFVKWMGSVLTDKSSKYYLTAPSLYAACLTILNREMATVAPAYTTGQVMSIETTTSTIPQVYMPMPAITAKDPKTIELLKESRILLTHPGQNDWWKPIVTSYAKKFGPSLAEEIKARNSGYANMPEK